MPVVAILSSFLSLHLHVGLVPCQPLQPASPVADRRAGLTRHFEAAPDPVPCSGHPWGRCLPSLVCAHHASAPSPSSWTSHPIFTFTPPEASSKSNRYFQAVCHRVSLTCSIYNPSQQLSVKGEKKEGGDLFFL